MRIKAPAIPAHSSLASANGVAQEKAQPPSSEFDKLLKANTSLVVWLIFFAIGGGLLALYYARIGYLPEMEWKAAMVYLFIGSTMGGVIGLLLTMSLYLPGVIWANVIVFDPLLAGELSYELVQKEPSGGRSSRTEPCVRSIMFFLGVPYLVALLISHRALRFSEGSNWPSIKIIDSYWVYAVLLLLVTYVLMHVLVFSYLTDVWNKSGQAEDTAKRQVVKYSFWFTLSVLLNQISMYLIYRLSDRTPDPTDFLVLTGMCTAATWISTLVVATSHRHYPRQAVIAALVTAGLLLFTADSFSSLSMKLMNHYGVGDYQKFNLLVNDDGAKVVRDLDLKCDDTYHYVCNVQILSKVGDQYFLKVHDEKLGERHITFPKIHVLSIQRLEDRSKLAQSGQN